LEHLALYRKYRPLRFRDVVGQNSVTSSLSAQVAGGKLSHAYLFTGTRGTGKTTCAKILARAACCEHPVNGDPCNECAACRSILSGAAMDITEIDAASNNGVDNIRELRQEALYAPAELKYRVYIIDEVHMLSQGAFNALLKTLEEPPAHVIFILATTELHKVPATILSRCQRYDFRRIPAELMAAALEDIAQKEGFGLDHAAADLLAAMGDGSMRDSITLLDRARSTADRVTVQSVTDALGLATEQEITAIFDAVLRNDAAGAIAAFTDCYMAGRDIVAIFDNMLSLLRDIYLFKATGQTDFLLSRWRAAAPAYAKTCSAARLESCIESINFFLSRTTRTSVKRLDGEMCLIKMALPDFGRVREVTEAPAEPVRAAPQKQPDETPPWDETPPPAGHTETPPAPAAPEPQRKEYEPAAPQSGRYDDLRRNLEGRVNSAVRVYLKSAATREEDGGIYIEIPEEGLIFINKPDVLDAIKQAGLEAGYTFVKVGKRVPVKRENPLDTIRSRAESLGVNVKVK